MKPDDAALLHERQHWMSALATASVDALESACAATLVPTFRWLRKPESGLMMVRARAGGTGLRFNLGEVTVTRCSLRLDSGIVGHAYVQGRSHRHAELAAMIDALLQDPEHSAELIQMIIDPLTREHSARRDERLRKAAATKVEFYTLARGDNE